VYSSTSVQLKREVIRKMATGSIFDIFDQDAFKMITLSGKVEQLAYKPTGLSKYFTIDRVRTEDVAIEFRKDKGLKILQTTQRGDPLQILEKTGSNIRKYSTTRIGEGSKIVASELQFVRQFSKLTAMKMLAQEIADRMGRAGKMGLVDDVETTLEYHRLGALQGKVLDADGSVIMDWSKEFANATENGGTGTIPTITWNMSPTKKGGFRVQANQVRRDIVKSLGGDGNKGVQIVNLCGHDFFDKLTQVPEIRETYLNAEKAYYVKGGDIFDSFQYPANVTWVDYREGYDSASDISIGDNECITFPKNVKGQFVECYAPAEDFRHLGTKGQKMYASIYRDKLRDRFVDLEVLSYPLMINTKPQSIRKGTATG